MPHIKKKGMVFLSIAQASSCLANVVRHLCEVRAMTLSSKREMIQAIRKVYRKSTKAQKGAHLDHLVLATGLEPTYLTSSIKFYTTTCEMHCGVLAAEVAEKLTRISAATIDRILLPTKRRWRKNRRRIL
jgi:hypothetical protein